MTASMRTKLRASSFEALRRHTGLTGDLVLYKTLASSGYEALATISEGWFADRERSSEFDQEFLVVRVEVTDANELIFTEDVKDYTSALGFMGRIFTVQHRVAPLGDPAEWTYRCNPTGEEV